MIKNEVLKAIYLFSDLTPEELGKIAKICTSHEMIAGQDVFIRGQKAESFFVIQQGTVKIVKSTDKGDEIKISSLATGSHFGEMAFLTGEPRLATAQTTETSYLIEVPYQGLRTLLNDDVRISDKFHRALARFLAQRLQATTGDLSQAKEALL